MAKQFTKFSFEKTIGDKPNDLKFKVIENYCIMHSGDKVHLEKALDNFAQLESVYKDHPSVLRGIAECFMLLKQSPKARNYLKKASELKWNPDDADDLEKCWLLSAASLLSVSLPIPRKRPICSFSYRI